MTDKKQTTLIQMESGQSGKVLQIEGGHGLTDRLSSMGVRPGQKLTKVSSMFMRGPVTVQLNGSRVAIGFGMAKKIMVELG
ncbi:ferrous iron transport protein A [Chloroflexota bacterium]